MDFGANKTPVEVIEEVEVLVLETFILMLMRSGTKSHGRN